MKLSATLLVFSISALCLLAIPSCKNSGTCTYDTDCPGTLVCRESRCVQEEPDGGTDGGVSIQSYTFETGSKTLSSDHYQIPLDSWAGQESTQTLGSAHYKLESGVFW
jgi:hypothetical protein